MRVRRYIFNNPYMDNTTAEFTVQSLDRFVRIRKTAK